MKEIGIIVAMDEEKEAIKNIMKNIQKEQFYNLSFLRGEIQAKKCILIKCGVGKVNAARATQIMIDKYNIEYMINAGVGGAVNSALNIGDVLIAKEIVQHDFDITAFGHKKGYITGVGERLICDETLTNKIENIIQEIPEKDYKIKMGTIATGDIFCTEPSMKDKIRNKFNSDVVDMECAAMAQVCYLDNIPFVALRSISDTPNGDNANTFDENLKLASGRCAIILNEILK